MNNIEFPRKAACFLAAFLLFSFRVCLADDLTTDYKVTPQDILQIAVVGEKDLVQDCRVSSSGTITYQWLSNVEVGGKTSAEIEQLLRHLLDKDYLVDPTVLVAVKEYRTREVTVIGSVNRPGSVPIPAEQPLTIVEAISRAGGTARGADLKKISFKRRGEEKKTLKWDDLNKETDPKKIIYVQPGDVIKVEEQVF
jgi:protein involved in polysaccharide export with SLBB domain